MCWALVLVLVVLRAPGVVIVVKGMLFVFCRMFRKGSSSLDALQQVGSRRRRTGPDHVSAYRELWTTRPLSFRKSVSPSLAPLPVACVAKHGQGRRSGGFAWHGAAISHASMFFVARMLRLCWQDHFNDVVSNGLSIVAIILATQVNKLWFFDPLFAILFACFIVFNWTVTGRGACRGVQGQTTTPSLSCARVTLTPL